MEEDIKTLRKSGLTQQASEMFAEKIEERRMEAMGVMKEITDENYEEVYEEEV